VSALAVTSGDCYAHSESCSGHQSMWACSSEVRISVGLNSVRKLQVLSDDQWCIFVYVNLSQWHHHVACSLVCSGVEFVFIRHILGWWSLMISWWWQHSVVMIRRCLTASCVVSHRRKVAHLPFCLSFYLKLVLANHAWQHSMSRFLSRIMRWNLG